MKSESPSQPDAESVVVEPEIVPRQSALPAEVRTELERRERRTAEEIIAEFEVRKEIAPRVLQAAVALTKPADWVVMGDTCYLQEYGCARLKTLIGFGYPGGIEPTIERQELGGGNFGYVVKGWAAASALGVYDFIIGARSSDEKFFDKFDEDGNRMPVSDSDVLKAAQTNWLARGVTGLIGGRGLTVQDLKELGVDTSRIRSVKFQKGAKGGGAGGTAPNFGNDEWRGKEWKDLPPDALKFYMAAAERSLKDESKKRYHVSDQKRLDAIKHEIHRRQGIAREQSEKKEGATDGGK